MLLDRTVDTDEALVERTLRGEVSAFEELVERHRAIVFRTAARIVGRGGRRHAGRVPACVPSAGPVSRHRGLSDVAASDHPERGVEHAGAGPPAPDGTRT